MGLHLERKSAVIEISKEGIKVASFGEGRRKVSSFGEGVRKVASFGGGGRKVESFGE